MDQTGHECPSVSCSSRRRNSRSACARVRARLNFCHSAGTGSLDRFNLIVLRDIDRRESRREREATRPWRNNCPVSSAKSENDRSITGIYGGNAIVKRKNRAGFSPIREIQSPIRALHLVERFMNLLSRWAYGITFCARLMFTTSGYSCPRCRYLK